MTISIQNPFLGQFVSELVGASRHIWYGKVKDTDARIAQLQLSVSSTHSGQLGPLPLGKVAVSQGTFWVWEQRLCPFDWSLPCTERLAVSDETRSIGPLVAECGPREAIETDSNRQDTATRLSQCFCLCPAVLGRGGSKGRGSCTVLSADLIFWNHPREALCNYRLNYFWKLVCLWMVWFYCIDVSKHFSPYHHDK